MNQFYIIHQTTFIMNTKILNIAPLLLLKQLKKIYLESSKIQHPITLYDSIVFY
jgi:hypothetical protein